MSRSVFTVLSRLAAVLCLALPGWPQTPPSDLTQRSLEDLMDIEVTSVAKKQQKISQTAAAIFVITAEDIRRSGATNIPDLLRMVPGIEVAQINASKWAISARGFNGQYSNKLLVMIDGRTVYTPVLSGVFWDTQDLPLTCIERIEVIRGPGAAVWGANAVNGVINIITKKASDTQGGLITARAGTSERGSGLARYGGRIGTHAAYRVFADGFERGHFPAPAGPNGQDDWHYAHAGFRSDASVSEKDSLTVEGDAYRGNAGEMANTVVSLLPPVTATLALRDRFSGWNVLSRWTRTISSSSETTLQAYFERSERGDDTYGIGQNTLDVDFQHHVGWGQRQDFVWGGGYRLSSDDTSTTLRISFDPASRNTQIFSAFVQDEIAIRPDRISLSLGARLEHNDFSGFALEPSARVAWTPDDRNTLWAAVSGAHHSPARGDTAIRYNLAALPGPNNLPLLVGLFGNPDQKPVRLTAIEAGYRKELSKKLSLDSTVFFHQYRDLTSYEPASSLRLVTDPPPLHWLALSSFANLVHGEAHGLEMFADWKVSSRWTLSPGYSFLTMHLHRSAASQDLTTVPAVEGGNPRHQAQLRSHLTLPAHWQWNASAYFVGRLEAPGVPAYTRLDTNLTWHPWEQLSITLAGQNLLRDRHLEYAGPDSSVQSSLIKRSAYAQLTWWF